jgi:hypothetical protein
MINRSLARNYAHFLPSDLQNRVTIEGFITFSGTSTSGYAAARLGGLSSGPHSAYRHNKINGTTLI